jgi:hypothetical protein
MGAIQLTQRWGRHDGAVAALYQHSARAGYLFLGGEWTLCRWEILTRCVRLRRKLWRRSATGFLTFVSGYNVFLRLIIGIMITVVDPFVLPVFIEEL